MSPKTKTASARLAVIAMLATLATACGSDAESDMQMESGAGMEMGEGAMGEMDHSQHMMGASTDRQMVHLTPEQERALGVRYVTVERRHLERTIRTVGRIVASEARIADVTPKVDGFVEDAYREVQPMVRRAQMNDGFWEWYTKDNEPAGWGTFRGSAGALGRAIEMLLEWAEETIG